jgi:hypothetical protein
MHEIYARTHTGNAKRFKDLLFHQRWHSRKEMSGGRGPAQFAASGSPANKRHLADAKSSQSCAFYRLLDFFFCHRLFPARVLELAQLVAELFLRHLAC